MFARALSQANNSRSATDVLFGSKFAGVLSDYVLPSLTGTTRFPMVAPVIFYEAATNGAWATASAMGTLVLAVVALFLIISSLAVRRLMPWQRAVQ